MRVHKLASACLLIGIATCMSEKAQSDTDVSRCSDANVKLVGKHFRLDNFVYPERSASENGGLIVAGICKPWPKNKSRVIAAFAYNAGIETEKSLVIAVIDTRANQVVAAYKSAIQEDAALKVGENSLRIDTARYDMAPGIRAFGVDITNSYHQGCVDGGLDTERTLYVPEHKNLRPVLKINAISYWRYVQGGNPDCGASKDVAVIVENVDLTLEMGNATTNGYRDIVVRAKSWRDDNKPTDKGKFSFVLRYAGSKYPTDLMDKAFERWDVWAREP